MLKVLAVLIYVLASPFIAVGFAVGFAVIGACAGYSLCAGLLTKLAEALDE